MDDRLFTLSSTFYLLHLSSIFHLLSSFIVMFDNREEAGLLLANKLKEYKKSQEAIVLAIPRGGVIVGKQIANYLALPLLLSLLRNWEHLIIQNWQSELSQLME